MLRITSQDCYHDYDSDKEVVHAFKGALDYWHYGAQNIDDRGWGCGYRTLQTIISWFKQNLSLQSTFPDLYDIQSVLVEIGDKEPTFIESKEWIGSVEVGLVIQHITNTDFAILQVPRGKFDKEQIDKIAKHFDISGAPVMMGGSTDNSSKCVLAIKENPSTGTVNLLILDPHYYSTNEEPSLEHLWKEGWLKWCNIKDLHETDFYNLCMPVAQYK